MVEEEDPSTAEVWAIMVCSKSCPIDEKCTESTQMPYISYEEHGRQTAMTRLIQATQKTALEIEDERTRRLDSIRRRFRRRVDAFATERSWALAGIRSGVVRKWLDALDERLDENVPDQEHRNATSEVVKVYLNYRYRSEYEYGLPLHPRRYVDHASRIDSSYTQPW